jgi:hypothetical protein
VLVAVVVPETTPVEELRLNPEGRVPLTKEKVGVFPESSGANNVNEYAPFQSTAVIEVVDHTGVAFGIVNALSTKFPPTSVALIVNGAVVMLVVVPAITPDVDVNVMLVGSAPDITE